MARNQELWETFVQTEKMKVSEVQVYNFIKFCLKFFHLKF